MKDLATQPKAAGPNTYKSKEELFVQKRKQMNEVLSKVDPEKLKAILTKTNR